MVANKKNLKGHGFQDKTAEEQRELAKKGGIASGIAKREKKQMREILEMIGEEEITNAKTGETATKKEVVCKQLYNKAMNGDLRAVDILSKLLGEQTANINLPPSADELKQTEAMKEAALATLQRKVDEITEMLKEQGRYNVEYNYQINIAAQLGLKADMLFIKTMLPDYKAINVQISREGNERETISATEQLYRLYASQFQSALTALGLNANSKIKLQANDGFNDFLNGLNEEEE